MARQEALFFEQLGDAVYMVLLARRVVARAQGTTPNQPLPWYEQQEQALPWLRFYRD